MPEGRWFRIRSAAEECQCPGCGEPLYVGDRAFQANASASARIVCSPGCAPRERSSVPVDYRARITRSEAS